MGWKRSRDQRRKDKHIYSQTKTWYGKGVWYDKEKGIYRRYYLPERVRYVKRKCNRAVRRYKGELGTKGTYRKISEFWWEVW